MSDYRYKVDATGRYYDVTVLFEGKAVGTVRLQEGATEQDLLYEAAKLGIGQQLHRLPEFVEPEE